MLCTKGRARGHSRGCTVSSTPSGIEAVQADLSEGQTGPETGEAPMERCERLAERRRARPDRCGSAKHRHGRALLPRSGCFSQFGKYTPRQAGIVLPVYHRGGLHRSAPSAFVRESYASPMVLRDGSTVLSGAAFHRPYGYLLTAGSAEVPDDHPLARPTLPSARHPGPKCPRFLLIRTQCTAPIPPSQPPDPDVSGTSMYTAGHASTSICAPGTPCVQAKTHVDAGVVAGTCSANSSARLASLAERCRTPLPSRRPRASPEPWSRRQSRSRSDRPW